MSKRYGDAKFLAAEKELYKGRDIPRPTTENGQRAHRANVMRYEAQMESVDKKDMPNQGAKTWKHPSGK